MSKSSTMDKYKTYHCFRMYTKIKTILSDSRKNISLNDIDNYFK